MMKKQNTLPTWDLKAIYSDLDLWQKDFEKIEPAAKKFAAFKGHLHESPELLKSALESSLALNRLIEKVYVYANLKQDEDTTVNVNRERLARVSALLAQLSPLEAYFTPELLAIPDAVMKKFLAAKCLQPYKRLLEEELRGKKHVLSEPEERILGSFSNVLHLSGDLFESLNDTDLRFGKLRDEHGELKELTHGSYLNFMESPDRKVRKLAFKKLYKQYETFRNTFAAALDGTVRRHVVSAQVRHFPSALAAALDSDKVPESVYRNLISAVHDKLGGFYDYMKLRREVLKLDQLDMYDIYTPLLPDCRRSFTFDEAQKAVCKAVKPLGTEYCKTLDLAFTQRWIDAPERTGKRSGAYSGGCFDTYPYVLMSFTSNLNDVFTLAHELGHSMHSYFSHHNQPYCYADYKIFVAEVASTTNEILLFEHLLETTKDHAFRAYLYGHLADEIRGTIHRQTMFAEFELFMHETVESGTPLTADLLTEKYRKLNALYYGSGVKPAPVIGLEWARIPHFHYNFYVYKYATGMSAALKLAANIRSGNAKLRDAYLGFLKAGSSKDVLDIMRDAGVDLSTPEPVRSALDYFGKVVKNLRKELAL